MIHLEQHHSYEGYDDYLDAVTYDYRGDLDEDDYDEELNVPKWLRV